jgi:hypothetical protein
MGTEDLILRLSEDLPRVPPHAPASRVGIGITAGALVALVLVITVSGGIRPDLQVAIHGFGFWMKLTYTLSLGVITAWAVLRLARPITGSLRGLWLLAIPVLVLAAIGSGELARTPSDQWSELWLGRSWLICPWQVLMLAVPIFAGLLWSFRKFAPTRLRAAGAAAGLASGAWGAALYCLHCPDVAAIYVLTWYSLGIGLAAGIGALLGPRLLRW